MNIAPNDYDHFDSEGYDRTDTAEALEWILDDEYRKADEHRKACYEAYDANPNDEAVRLRYETARASWSTIEAIRRRSYRCINYLAEIY